MPVSVFLASQLTSRVLVRQLPERLIMAMGTLTATLGLVLAMGIGRDTSYLQVAVSLILIGAGSGTAMVVPLTSASLADVEPDIAGAASGLVNVSQQIGAAIGLAVLVTIFNSLAGHPQLGPGSVVDPNRLVHSFDLVFGVAALFCFAAFVTVAVGVRRVRATSPADNEELALSEDDFVLDLPVDAALALSHAEV